VDDFFLQLQEYAVISTTEYSLVIGACARIIINGITLWLAMWNI
jgi:hypothetical protein